MSDKPEIQVAQPAALSKASTFAPRSLAEAMQFADLLLTSGMAPKSYREIITKVSSEAARAAVVVALQFGMELGLQPMQSLQNIASINGQPAIWGDAALALVHASGVCEYVIEEDFETITRNKKAICKAKRKGGPEVVRTFSYQNAQDAGIFGNAVWKTYPYRMCQMRARSFALRDAFPDVLKGLVLAEEVQDYVDAPAAAPSPKVEYIQDPAKQIEATDTNNDPTGVDWARAYYKAYTASGYSIEDSKAKIAEIVGAVTDSREVPMKFAKALEEWAATPKAAAEENLDAEPA